MIGNKIKMPNNLEDGLIEYADGTVSTVDQMAKDVTTFLAWAAEPELEERHRTGVKVIIYLVLAIGEIGLDYYYEHADAQTQIAAFEGQLNIAADCGKPIYII